MWVFCTMTEHETVSTLARARRLEFYLIHSNIFISFPRKMDLSSFIMQVRHGYSRYSKLHEHSGGCSSNSSTNRNAGVSLQAECLEANIERYVME